MVFVIHHTHDVKLCLFQPSLLASRAASERLLSQSRVTDASDIHVSHLLLLDVLLLLLLCAVLQAQQVPVLSMSSLEDEEQQPDLSSNALVWALKK
jgi:hypothetical protein